MTDKTQQAMEREALTDCVEALKAADSETRDLYYNHPALIINALDKARAALSPAATPEPQGLNVADWEIISVWDAWPKQGIYSRGKAIEFVRALEAYVAARASAGRAK